MDVSRVQSSSIAGDFSGRRRLQAEVAGLLDQVSSHSDQLSSDLQLWAQGFQLALRHPQIEAVVADFAEQLRTILRCQLPPFLPLEDAVLGSDGRTYDRRTLFVVSQNGGAVNAVRAHPCSWVFVNWLKDRALFEPADPGALARVQQAVLACRPNAISSLAREALASTRAMQAELDARLQALSERDLIELREIERQQAELTSEMNALDVEIASLQAMLCENNQGVNDLRQSCVEVQLACQQTARMIRERQKERSMGLVSMICSVVACVALTLLLPPGTGVFAIPKGAGIVIAI